LLLAVKCVLNAVLQGLMRLQVALPHCVLAYAALLQLSEDIQGCAMTAMYSRYCWVSLLWCEPVAWLCSCNRFIPYPYLPDCHAILDELVQQPQAAMALSAVQASQLQQLQREGCLGHQQDYEYQQPAEEGHASANPADHTAAASALQPDRTIRGKSCPAEDFGCLWLIGKRIERTGLTGTGLTGV